MVECKEKLSGMSFYAENRRMTLAMTIACQNDELDSCVRWNIP
jgi:hypothetical protein